jgi:choline dehydrogenase
VANQREQPFDYVIVGAGAAGCVLAHRLSADSSVRVLLVDGGDDGSGREGGAPYARGQRSCYTSWTEAGGAAWSYDALLPFFMRSERHEGGASTLRGGDGPLSVSFCTDPNIAHRAFLASAKQIGFKGDARADFNQPAPVDLAAYFQKTMVDGRPQSVFEAFVEPVRARTNLTLRSGARAARLIVEGRRAAGVELVRGGDAERVRASRDVILCGGALESARLLLLSGIGPADHLRAVGVPVVADLRGVGSHLHEHARVAVRWDARGELMPSSVTAGLFTRSSQAAAARPPDLLMRIDGPGQSVSRELALAATLVQPQSRGNVRLRSADPTVAPLVQANRLQAQADIDALVRGVRVARWFADEGDALRDLIAGEREPGPAARTDEALAAFVRRTAAAASIGAGTCRMGPASDPDAVVDASLRVRGADGLRVADASVMPEIVNAPPLAAVLAIGEKAADLLRS